MITIIDNFKNALGDTDKSQFLKAISLIDKLSPINVVVNFHGVRRSFFCNSNCNNGFLDSSRKESIFHGLYRDIKQTKNRFF